MLITAGLVVLADVGLTLAWKEPLSTVYGSIQQGKAEDELARIESSFLSEDVRRRVADIEDVEERVEALAGIFADQLKTGRAIGRIEIPRMDLDAVVVEGTDTASLQKGPGHYTSSDDAATREQGDGSALPGQGKTVGIAGHRTTYLAPFRRLNELKPGDEIMLEMPYATFTYEVQKTEIVDPDAISVVENVGYERLVLSACHPLYSAAQRIIAFAKLSDISLFAAGGRWNDP